ncbi:MAG: LysR family transcriptional regulator substrate-binding protein [Ruminococcus sp.]|nr:LysR family transcriptional regulator substrate-binding protein [Ruminococcus sp.]
MKTLLYPFCRSITIGLMHKKYPNVKFHIHCCDSIEALERMQNDKCDFIFIPYIDHDIKSLYSNMLLPLRSAWGYLISKNSPLAAMDGMRFPDIKNIPLLVPESFFNDRASLDWMRNFTEDMNIIGTYNTISGCCDLINENRCIALAHCFSADSYEDADLCFHQILPTSSYMIWKNNASLSLSARIFMSYFEEVACEKAAENTTVG